MVSQGMPSLLPISPMGRAYGHGHDWASGVSHYSLCHASQEGMAYSSATVGRDHVYTLAFTVNTGQGAKRTTFSPTLPIKKPLMPECPWVAITIRSMSKSLAAWTISR